MDERPLVMIIDQEKKNREVLQKIFSLEYDLLEASNADTARQLLRENSTIKLIIVAVFLPNVDGFDFIDRLQQDDSLQNTLLMAAVLSGDEGSELRALQLGLTDFISFPYNESLVLLKVRNVLNRYGGNPLLAFPPLPFCEEVSTRDSLTGLFAREEFAGKTASLLKANREGEYLLLYFDIDCFKIVNALFGTERGDMVLRKTAKCFEQIAGTDGLCGRLEGDHFIACLPAAAFSVEGVLADLAKSLAVFEDSYQINFSLGIYEIADKTLPVDQMCDRARLAANTVKGNYMKHYAFYDTQMRDKMLREQQILREMDFALRHGEFVIYLQPIFSVAKECPVSAEALVRWKHPERGIISPGEFIPLFEKNGFIVKLDAFVWEKACEVLAELIKNGDKVVPVSVNVSRLNFYNPNFCEFIIALVKKYNLEPEMLKLEITESAYTDNPHYILSGMEKLQKAGFEILMDDFGSAYSSLNMLNDVSVDALKIDMKFVNALGTSAKAGNIMTSIVRMAKWLDITVIAEGVETKEQLDFLRSIGCPRVQGYYFSKPLPIDAFRNFLAQAQPESRNVRSTEAASFDFDAIWDSSKVLSELFNGLLGSVGIYELYNDSLLEVLRVNDDYYEMTGSTPQSVFNETTNVFSWIHPEDKTLLLHACRQAETEKSSKQVYVRRYHQSGNVLWLELKIRFLGHKEKSAFFYFAANDVTEEIFRQQSNMRYHLLENVLREFDIDFWTIDIEKRTASISDVVSRQLGLSEQHLLNVPQSLIDAGLVQEDSIPIIRTMFEKIYQGKKIVSANLKLKMKDGRYHWSKVKHVVFFDDQGKAYKAIGSLKRVTDSQEARVSRWQALQNPLLINRDFRYAVDLSANEILRVDRAIMPRGPSPGDVYSEVIDQLAQLYIHPQERQKFKLAMDKDTLLAVYASGQKLTTLSFLSRYNGDRYRYLKIMVQFFPDKETGHIYSLGDVKIAEEEPVTMK